MHVHKPTPHTTSATNKASIIQKDFGIPESRLKRLSAAASEFISTALKNLASFKDSVMGAFQSLSNIARPETPIIQTESTSFMPKIDATPPKETIDMATLKSQDISSQLSTLKSEYAKPEQRDAVKSALTELIKHHIEQGTGQAFTSAAITSQIAEEIATPGHNSATLLRSTNIGTLAFSIFAKEVGSDYLKPMEEKIATIGNAELMEVRPERVDIQTLLKNQMALQLATADFLETVANSDRGMPESLKDVLTDVIMAAGDEGKTAFNGTFFLRLVTPMVMTSIDDTSPNKQSTKTIATLMQKTANAWSLGNTTVDLAGGGHPHLSFLDEAASQMIGKFGEFAERIIKT